MIHSSFHSQGSAPCQLRRRTPPDPTDLIMLLPLPCRVVMGVWFSLPAISIPLEPSGAQPSQRGIHQSSSSRHHTPLPLRGFAFAVCTKREPGRKSRKASKPQRGGIPNGSRSAETGPTAVSRASPSPAPQRGNPRQPRAKPCGSMFEKWTQALKGRNSRANPARVHPPGSYAALSGLRHDLVTNPRGVAPDFRGSPR